MLEVVAALIWREGRFLIAQRPPHKSHGMLWEFVGGKVEPGETLETALVRECREELGVLVQPQEVFMSFTHTYPDVRVHLTLFHTLLLEGEPQLLEHTQIQWITPSEIPDYDFCPADEVILKKIIKESETHGQLLSTRDRDYADSEAQRAAERKAGQTGAAHV